MEQTKQITSKPRLDRDSLHEKSNFLSDIVTAVVVYYIRKYRRALSSRKIQRT